MRLVLSPSRLAYDTGLPSNVCCLRLVTLEENTRRSVMTAMSLAAVQTAQGIYWQNNPSHVHLATTVAEV